jgi:cell wall-associated NlpC family hydrolase
MNHSATIENYIGKPFRSGARGPDAYDCWGLVIDVYRRLYGIDLPDFDIAATAVHQIAGAIASQAAAPQWARIAPAAPLPTPCVAVLAAVPGHPNLVTHCAVHIGGGRLLHALESTGVSIITPRHPYWQPKLRGFYLWTGGDPCQP